MSRTRRSLLTLLALFVVASSVHASTVLITGSGGDTYCMSGTSIPDCVSWSLAGATCQTGCPGTPQITNNTLGASAINQYLNGIVVSSIGASGNDGVLVSLSDTIQFDMDLSPIDFSPVGATVDASAIGLWNGNPSAPLGHVTIANIGSGVRQVTADYSPIGATTVRVEIWDGDTCVRRVSVPMGIVGTFSGTINGIGKTDGTTGCIIMDFPSQTTFTIAGGNGSGVGNQVRVLAANPTFPVQSLTSFSFKGANIGGSFTFKNQARRPLVPVPALSWQGLLALFVLMAGTTAWMFRRTRATGPLARG